MTEGFRFVFHPRWLQDLSYMGAFGFPCWWWVRVERRVADESFSLHEWKRTWIQSMQCQTV